MNRTNPSIPSATVDLRVLVAEIREVVARGYSAETTAQLVGERLAPRLGLPGLLTEAQCQGSPDRYHQHLLHAEPDGSFSLVALVWLPGQSTSVHDHVSWCVAGVHQGQEHERRYRLLTVSPIPRLVAIQDVVNQVGDISAFAPPGDIHRVQNAGSGRAVSLHVYGADISRLKSSVRRIYRLPTDQ
ncbi:cysteine dioxygenase [Streptomyces sp. NPDC048208]|uniref:cysteine dioxygenase family protein n=1 Tax=Streptomyces sp. NPDC048208 TaxID=3365515 RepID=UPI0037221E89